MLGEDLFKSKTNPYNFSDKTVAVIGAGGLGCNILVHLSGTLFKRIYICDGDKVSLANFNRQFLYTVDDENKSKAEIAAQKLKKYSPDTDFVSINKRIESASDLDFAKDCDIIILAVDNIKTRILVSHFCTDNNIPLVDGGINGHFGNAYLYIPGISACIECVHGENEYQKPVSISYTVGITAAAEVSLALRCLNGEGEQLCGKLYLFDINSLTSDTLVIKQLKNCYCNKRR